MKMEEFFDICPIMSKASRDTLGADEVDCIGHKCHFWILAYTTELLQYHECAYIINALKNSEGKIPV